MATRSKSPRAGRPEPGAPPDLEEAAAKAVAALRGLSSSRDGQDHIHNLQSGNLPTKGNSMFQKLMIAIAVSVAAAFFPATERYAIWIFFIAVVVAFVMEGVRIVPQQYAFVVERLGRFHGTLEPGLNIIIPFFDRVAYMHSLKEVPLDVPEQVCITKDDT